MNKFSGVGRLTKDPDIKFGQGNGVAVTKFTLAINRRFKKEGQPDADFIPVVCFGKLAEAVANYSAKGKLVDISGSIQTSKYDKDGVTHYKTECVADEVNFLEWAIKTEENKVKGHDTEYTDIEPIEDGDIPF